LTPLAVDLSSNALGVVSNRKLSLYAQFHKELADVGEIAFAPTFIYQ
jgi:hypothetical protein